MKKNKIMGALALMIMGTSPAFAADNKTADFQASAEVENVCLIEADDVNFGQVYAPLTQQGTKSEMRVLCSKGTSYTVDLNYGGNFVDPSGNSSSSYQLKESVRSLPTNPEKATNYRIFNGENPIGDGKSFIGSTAYYEYNLLGDNNLGDFGCYSSLPGKVYVYSQDAIDMLSPGSSVNGYVDDIHGVCNQGVVNIANFNAVAGGASANDKGAMIGAMKGNALAYQITLLGDITKPWIANVNAYQATASGEFDKIEVNARIMPDSSSSLYPAQDSYFDTVTAVISY